jgi:hypothetical protein
VFFVWGCAAFQSSGAASQAISRLFWGRTSMFQLLLYPGME